MTKKERIKLSNTGVTLFDSHGRPRRLPRPDTPEKQALLLWRVCKALGKMKVPYTWGGGHTGTFMQLTKSVVRGGLDCSGSVGLACYIANVPGSDGHTPAVSSVFEDWFDSGVGQYVTINAKGNHVWISFNIKRLFGFKSIITHPWRFDTSPWGDASGSGPRMRKLPRSTAGFVRRHPHRL